MVRPAISPEATPGQRVIPSVLLQNLVDYIGEPPTAQQDHWAGNLLTGMPYRLYSIPYENTQQGSTLALVAGDPEFLSKHPDGPHVRLHSACGYSTVGMTVLDRLKIPDLAKLEGQDLAEELGMLYPSEDCDCEAQASEAFEQMAIEGGVFFDLIEQEARNLGAATYKERLDLKRKIYRLMAESDVTTYEACDIMGVQHDTRDYDHCAAFLLEVLGIDRAQLLTNNPLKVAAFARRGVKVLTVEHSPEITPLNKAYVASKQRHGHLISKDFTQ